MIEVKTELVKLDGKTNRIQVFIQKDNDFIKDKYGVKRFKSVEVAKSYLFNIGYHNPYDYKFRIILDSIDIDFDSAEFYNGHYEYYCEENNTWYFIEPDNTEKITSIGYIVFADGDEKSADKNGYTKNREYMKQVKSVCNDIVKYPKYISRIYFNNNGLYTLCVKGTTAKIYICTNAQMMDINAKRKDCGERCIPYLNTMDKFKSLFVFTTKNYGDYIKDDHKVECVVSSIMDELLDRYPESNPRYSRLEFKGKIIV